MTSLDDGNGEIAGRRSPVTPDAWPIWPPPFGRTKSGPSRSLPKDFDKFDSIRFDPYMYRSRCSRKAFCCIHLFHRQYHCAPCSACKCRAASASNRLNRLDKRYQLGDVVVVGTRRNYAGRDAVDLHGDVMFRIGPRSISAVRTSFLPSPNGSYRRRIHCGAREIELAGLAQVREQQCV